MARFIEPVTLRGERATLEPLAREHVGALREAARDGELWRLWFTSVPSPEGVDTYVDTALSWRETREAMPFGWDTGLFGYPIYVSRTCGELIRSSRRLTLIVARKGNEPQFPHLSEHSGDVRSQCGNEFVAHRLFLCSLCEWKAEKLCASSSAKMIWAR